jgi:excisionase family DNA binding protein
MNETAGPSTTGWMTTAEAADYLRIERRTLLKWVREGSIRAYSLHGTKRRTWRFLREDLDAAMGITSPSSTAVLSSSASSVALQ